MSWRPREPLIWEDDGSYLSRADLPAVSVGELRVIDNALDQKQRAMRGQAQQVAELWVQERGREIALSSGDLGVEDGVKIARRALEKGALGPDFVLIDSDGVQVTLRELLAAPHENHGRRFHDPLEPDYRNDPRIAVFLGESTRAPRIYSHAHGGQSWRCDAGGSTTELGLMEETVEEIKRALAQDSEELYRSGSGIVSVDETQARGTVQITV